MVNSENTGSLRNKELFMIIKIDGKLSAFKLFKYCFLHKAS